MASLDITAFPLLQKAIAENLFHDFHEHGFELRFVGGCVRDAYLGITTKDIDLATTATPEQMIVIFNDHGIKWIPTGIDFGTITIVIDHIPFQITSLRKDWQTDGRHARVLFGTNWLEDAKRRDFTFNALYADEAGHIFDYFNGLDDLKVGHVRFIGDPQARIEEDHLRILRFFRFYAHFGKIAPTATLLALFARSKQSLKTLSRERITDEILKLLAMPSPLTALRFMETAEIFQAIFEKTFPHAVFDALLVFEKELELPPEALRRLRVLQPSLMNLRLSNRVEKQCYFIQNFAEQFSAITAPTEQDFYYHGYQNACEAYLLTLVRAIATQQIPILTAVQAFQKISAHPWEKPLFPLTGDDLIEALALKPGQELGRYLKACEAWWVSLQFKPDRQDCLKWVQDQLK